MAAAASAAVVAVASAAAKAAASCSAVAVSTIAWASAVSGPILVGVTSPPGVSPIVVKSVVVSSALLIVSPASLTMLLTWSTVRLVASAT